MQRVQSSEDRVESERAVHSSESKKGNVWILNERPSLTIPGLGFKQKDWFKENKQTQVLGIGKWALGQKPKRFYIELTKHNIKNEWSIQLFSI